MTDIVERLHSLWPTGCGDEARGAAIMDEAADEITQLRAERERMRDLIRGYFAARNRLDEASPARSIDRELAQHDAALKDLRAILSETPAAPVPAVPVTPATAGNGAGEESSDV